jgi:hypothetical protein
MEGTCGEEAVDGFVPGGGGFVPGGDGEVVSGGGGEEQAGEGEMSGVASDPCVSGAGAWRRGVIFGRLQPGRVEKLDLSFSLGQG